MEGEASLPLFSPEIMVMNPSFRPAVPLLPPITLFHGTADFSIPYEARYCDMHWLPSESPSYFSWVRAWRDFLSCTFFTVCWYGMLQCHFWRGITIGGCKGVYNFVPWQNTHRLILAGSCPNPETLFIDWFVYVGGEKFPIMQTLQAHPLLFCCSPQSEFYSIRPFELLGKGVKSWLFTMRERNYSL